MSTLTDFCWLVELFLPEGNSLGYYHTGFTGLMPGDSRSTNSPHEAKRYATKEAAEAAASKLMHLQGVWRAVEHGFSVGAGAAESPAPKFQPEEGDRFICAACGHSFNCIDETERPRDECPVCGEAEAQRVEDYLAAPLGTPAAPPSNSNPVHQVERSGEKPVAASGGTAK